MDSAGEQYVAKSAEEMDEERQQQVKFKLMNHFRLKFVSMLFLILMKIYLILDNDVT